MNKKQSRTIFFDRLVIFISPAYSIEDRRFYRYDLYDPKWSKSPIFWGIDYSTPVHWSPLEDRVWVDLLDFLLVYHGDTDSEYFDQYSSGQLAWLDQVHREGDLDGWRFDLIVLRDEIEDKRYERRGV